MKEKNVTIQQAAEAMNVNPTTLYRRIWKDGEKFTVTEVGKLAALLNLDSDTTLSIFFAR
ncbi:MAG: helix-turn-helix transcriptional regulator [Clostridia bacterium]|nr:helix-turn-helix transcriptional regulator [Clostridia bacterium]